MSFTFVNSGTSADSNTVQVANVVAGNLIVLWFKTEGTIGTPTVSDGTSSLSVRPVNSHGNGDLHGFFAYLLSANSGNPVTYTVTPGGSGSFKRIVAMQFSYTGGSISFDTDIATADGTSTAPNSGNITTTGTDELVLGGYGEYSDSTVSSRLINGSAADGNVDSSQTSLWRRAVGATFTGAASCTIGPSAAWICSAIAFKISASSSESTISPLRGELLMVGQIPGVNSFTNVRIREVLINNAGSPVGGKTGIHLKVWYAGRAVGAPDLSLSDMTTDADGTTSWSIATGSLVLNQAIFYVADDGGASLSQYTCARMIPTYT